MSADLEIIAHRGASWLAPENTLAAARLAWEEGADAVEADFRLTRDGQVVAIHDDSTLRVAGIDLRISESTFAELRVLDAGSWKDPRWAGERIPSLGEMLQTMPPNKRFYIEIKSGPEIAPALAAAIQAARVQQDQIILISFGLGVLAAARRLLPRCPTYLIGEFLHDSQTGVWYPDADELIAAAISAELTGIDLMAARLRDEGLISRAHAAGLDLCVWTVDRVEEARWFLDRGVRRITTNRPGALREELETAR